MSETDTHTENARQFSIPYLQLQHVSVDFVNVESRICLSSEIARVPLAQRKAIDASVDDKTFSHEKTPTRIETHWWLHLLNSASQKTDNREQHTIAPLLRANQRTQGHSRRRATRTNTRLDPGARGRRNLPLWKQRWTEDLRVSHKMDLYILFFCSN